MTKEEIVSMVNYGIKISEIKHYRKQVASQSVLTLSAGIQTISFPMPEAARFFFGIRRNLSVNSVGVLSVELNGDLIVDNASSAMFDSDNLIGGTEHGSSDESYIETCRKLSGNDSLFFILSNNQNFVETYSVFYAIDDRILPKEGVNK